MSFLCLLGGKIGTSSLSVTRRLPSFYFWRCWRQSGCVHRVRVDEAVPGPSTLPRNAGDRHSTPLPPLSFSVSFPSIMRFSLSSPIPRASPTRATVLAVIYSNQDNAQARFREPANDALLVLLPLLIVLSTFLFLLLLFLICILLLRRRRGIALRDNDGPIDMSRDDLVQGEGGFDGVESRWLESVNDGTRRLYLRAKGSFSFQF